MSEKKFHEIFRAGTYTVQVGGKIQVVELSEANIQEIVDLFDPNFLAVPITLDHIKTGPAYGWVSALKKQGSLLLASFQDVDPEFQDAVNQKKYKRISAEILLSQETPKGNGSYLRAVTFLGANSPAVKGLKEVNFSEDSTPVCVDFHEKEPVHEIVAVTFGEGSEAKVINILAGDKETANALLAKFADIEAAKAKAESDLKTLRLTYRKNEYKTFLNEMIAYGNVTPAQVDDMLKVMESLDAITEFSDVEGSVFETYKTSIKALPKIVTFNELATKEAFAEVIKTETSTEFADADPERKALHEKILAFAAEHKITYAEALTKVSK